MREKKGKKEAKAAMAYVVDISPVVYVLRYVVSTAM